MQGLDPQQKLWAKESVHDFSYVLKTLHINVTGTFNMLRFAADAMSKKNIVAEGDEDRG